MLSCPFCLALEPRVRCEGWLCGVERSPLIDPSLLAYSKLTLGATFVFAVLLARVVPSFVTLPQLLYAQLATSGLLCLHALAMPLPIPKQVHPYRV